jgi:hypothetical protein
LALSIYLSLSWASAGWSQDRNAAACNPKWIFLSKKPISTKSGAYETEFSGILIGCRSRLEDLSEQQLTKVQEALKLFLSERSLRLIGGADSEELRAAAVAAVNKALGKSIVSDIYFSSLSVGEVM